MGKLTKIIKLVFVIALVAFLAALFLRICQSDHKALEDIKITDKFIEAYKEDSNIRTHAVNDGFSENGAVFAYSLVYMKDAGYIQVTVRYNTRHIDEVILSYPEFKEESIRYELVDKNGKTYAPNIIGEEAKYNYHYFKLEFTNVDFSTENLSVKMILDGIDINVGDKSTLVVHRSDDTSIPFILSDEQMSLINK